MALGVGTRLGAYEITGELGAGGMGEVYRATDTDLKRGVAIKILPQTFATLASLVGGTAAFLGFWIAYRWDLPVGPTDVVLLGVLYAGAWLTAKLLLAGSRFSAKKV